VHTQIISALQDVWTCVHDVLCNDAPEGYMPVEAAEDEGVTTKDILSYSWRALKEARYAIKQRVKCRFLIADYFSSLVRVMVLKAPVGDKGPLSNSDFEALSALVFTELSELRHRGAFSAVAQAFAACCSRCHSSNHLELLNRLYQVGDTVLDP
jgi:hypothetical protein